jgi:hypothetical protein
MVWVFPVLFLWALNWVHADNCLPVPASEYAFAPENQAKDGTHFIDLEFENSKVSCFLQTSAKYTTPIILVPGYTSKKNKKPIKLNEGIKIRLKTAVEMMPSLGAIAILVTGGNVHPTGTPYNEALEMKKYLVNELFVPEKYVAMEPYAKHTPNNIRNSGRFLLAHGIKVAMIYTWESQNYRFRYPVTSLFYLRSLFTMGALPGKFKGLGKLSSLYYPSQKVFKKGPDPHDP